MEDIYIYIHRSLATKGTHEAASDAEFSSTTRFHRSTRVRKSCSATWRSYLLIIVDTIVDRLHVISRYGFGCTFCITVVDSFTIFSVNAALDVQCVCAHGYSACTQQITNICLVNEWEADYPKI